MAIFDEREPGLAAAIALPLIAFMLIFPVWHLGERDLYWAEGEYAAVAHEMTSFPPTPTAHGEIMPEVYPLFPLLVSKLHSATGLSIEFCLRFLSVLSLAGLGALAWESCRRTLGLQAAAVAAAMTVGTVLAAEKAIDGYPHMMALLLVTAAWLSWFTFGQSRGDWDSAWTAAGLFAGLAFYCNGWEALAYFIVPLLFMRRPLSIWGKLNRPGFYAGAGLVLGFFLLYAIPRWKLGLSAPPPRPMPQFDGGVSVKDYLEQLVLFPFEVALRFMPWTLLVWAPFCAAIVPLDKNPLFSRFLKTIVISLFLLLWLLPETHGRDILVLGPPLAMLVALHYWIAVRRGGDAVLKIARFSAWLGLASAALCLAFYLAPMDRLSPFLSFSRNLSYKNDFFIRGVIESAVAGALFLATVWLCKTRGKVWVCLLALFAGAMTLFWAAANPYKAADRDRSDLGRLFREALGPAAAPELVVYKDASIAGLYSECEYMGCKVKKLNSVSDLPAKAKEVYVIAPEVPSVPERTWTNLLPPDKRYKDRRICLWKGALKEDRRSDATKRIE